jgi:hypothetical protein
LGYIHLNGTVVALIVSKQAGEELSAEGRRGGKWLFSMAAAFETGTLFIDWRIS